MSPMFKYAARVAIARNYHLLGIFLFVGMAGGAIAFPLTFLSNSNVLLGLCLFPFGMFFYHKPRFSYIYLGLMLCFGVMGYIYNVRTFYFFMIAFYFLFVFEAFVGKVNSIVFF